MDPSVGGARDTFELVADVAAISSGSEPPDLIAEDALERLQDSFHFDAAAICSFDPATGKHSTLSQLGYEPDVLRYLNHGFVTDDPAFIKMRYGGMPVPMRWCDVPDYKRSFSAQAVFLPNGYREGVSAPLFKADGSYTGIIHLSSGSPEPLRATFKLGLVALQKHLATVTDPLRSRIPEGWEQHTGGDSSTKFLSDNGALEDLPTASQIRNDLWNPAVVDIVRRVVSVTESPLTSFWLPGAPGKGTFVRITQVQKGHVVTLAAKSLPYTLTNRELEILTLLAAGMTNPEIGARLSLSPRTVGSHVENLLKKLDSPNRSGAVAFAIAQGIVPIVGADHHIGLGLPSHRL